MKKRLIINPTTMKALEGSIRKWERIVAGNGVDHFEVNCPLCILFDKREGRCDHCPIDLDSKHACVDTPHAKWANHHYDDHQIEDDDAIRVEDGCTTCQRLAQAELDYLVDLRFRCTVKTRVRNEVVA